MIFIHQIDIKSEKMKLILSFLLLSIASFAQSKNELTSGFNQIINITDYRGGQFKMTAYAKAESSNVNMSIARLFASILIPNGAVFQDNKLISQGEWKEYTIEGPIDEKADNLVFGAYYYGIGKYYFDKFEIMIKKTDSEWESLKVINNSFEGEEGISDKWLFSKYDGFLHTLITESLIDGKRALLIDGSPRTKFGKYVEINGIKMYYEFHGHGKDTIMLLHGNGQHIKAFNKQIPEFTKKFTVLALDSRAQGYSSDDGKRITYDVMAEDVNSLLDSLKIKKINILGWSDGGNTGLILAMKHPDKVKKLATMGANLFCDSTSVDEKDTEQLKVQLKKLVDANTPDTDYQLRMLHLLLEEPNINPKDLKNISCQVLIMAGSKDIIKERHTKLIAKNIDKSKLVIFKDGTHFEPQENPDRFNKTVMNFFNEK